MMVPHPPRQPARRRFPGGWRLAALAVLFSVCLQSADAPGQDTLGPPNIVLIVADDLGYGDLSCYGQTKYRTPHIDRLAREGMRFTDFYAGSTVCAPSRCVLMTGQHTGHCFIRGNSKQNLRAGDVTVAEMLQRGGYKCGAFGKWGLGHENSGGLPTLQGFDAFYGYLDQTHAHNYFPEFLIRNRKREPLSNVVPNATPDGAGVATEKNQYAHDLIVEEARAFIERNRDDPFFLYLPVTIPHANNEAGQAGMEIPDMGRFANEDWPAPEQAFAAMVTHLDQDVGLILDLLEDLRLTERTIVLFTSDNGPHKEGGRDPAFFQSSGPFRGIKRDLYEGGIRVPLIARWPGRIPADSVSAHWSYFGDLFATFCDLAGVTPPPDLDSVSLAPTLLNRPKDQQLHAYLYWEFHERGFAQAVRHGEWKAVHQGGPEGKIELYNLADDPAETTDVSAQEPNVVRQMAAFMNDAHQPSPHWPVNSQRKNPQ
ncbi:MAG: arylsulfatase [Planctomyces sp.]|nr:arylsulfatase [Planctomyces sp.]